METARGGSWWKLLVGVLLGYVLTRSVVSSVVSRRQKDALSHHVLTEVSSTTGSTSGVNAPTRGGNKGGSGAPAPAGRSAVHVRDVGLLYPGSIVGTDMTAGTGTAIMTLDQHLPACDMRPEALLRKHTGEASGPAEAPREIPPRLSPRFTLDGRVDVRGEYYNDVSWGTGAAEARHYAAVDIGNMVTQVKAKATGDYEPTDRALYALLDRWPDLLRGKRVVVMGSVRPWYEAMAFAYGASEVLTIEYGLRKTDYPHLSFATPMGVANCSLDYDVGMSISSFEHDGLGRYGDPLNPEGDLIAMSAMRRLVKPDGMLLFAVPMGVDTIVFNAHRVYGKYRWPLMTAGWDIVDYAGVPNELWTTPYSTHLQPAWLLKNTPHRA